MTSRKQKTVIGISLIGVIGMIRWLYFKRQTQEEESTLTTNSPTNRNRTILSLSTHIIPPLPFLVRLSQLYIIHLIFPAHTAFVLPSEYTQIIDQHRILFHSTSSGALHMGRAIGGTFVKIRSNVTGDALPEGGAAAAVVGSDAEDVGKFVEEIRTFVHGIVILSAPGEKETTLDQLKNHGRGVSVAQSWNELEMMLGV